ncbi:MAG TPA: hypothetical protein VFB62_21575 [Polyangiaceae bacterium]|jgi:hypothetical protein|nr:hypothetical protein [Polyangiaceae bacterium]
MLVRTLIATVAFTLTAPVNASPLTPMRIEARSEARTAVISIEERTPDGAKRTQIVNLALDGRNTSSLDLDGGENEYQLSVRKEFDDGKAAILQLSLLRKRHTQDHVTSARISVRKRIAIGKPALMTSVDGTDYLRVTATLR